MERRIECLSCGHQRVVDGEPGECTRCHYLGWAPADDLSEALRSRLRRRPVELRRFDVETHRRAS
jgi:hypothetical protein